MNLIDLALLTVPNNTNNGLEIGGNGGVPMGNGENGSHGGNSINFQRGIMDFTNGGTFETEAGDGFVRLLRL